MKESQEQDAGEVPVSDVDKARKELFKAAGTLVSACGASCFQGVSQSLQSLKACLRVIDLKACLGRIDLKTRIEKHFRSVEKQSSGSAAAPVSKRTGKRLLLALLTLLIFSLSAVWSMYSNTAASHSSACTQTQSVAVRPPSASVTSECDHIVPHQLFTDPRTSFRQNFVLLVKEQACRAGRKVRIAEIGVRWGNYSQIFYERVGDVIEEYVMVEPHEKFFGEPHGDLLARREKLSREYPDVKLTYVNEISADAHRYFADDYFDFIYLDGLHTYAGVKTDIRVWWPKLKEGGILAGHDYVLGQTEGKKENVINANVPIAGWWAPTGVNGKWKERPGFGGIVRAIHEFAFRENVQIHFTLEGRYGDMTNMQRNMDSRDLFPDNCSWFTYKRNYRVRKHDNAERASWNEDTGVYTLFKS